MLKKKPILHGVITFQNSQGNEARGSLMKVSRTTVVMEVYNPYSIIQLSEVLPRLSIYRGEHQAYSGRGVVSNLVNTGLMLIVSVTLIDPWSEMVDFIETGESIGSETDDFVHKWAKTRRLRPDYLIAISELKSFLSELSHWLDQVDVGYQTVYELCHKADGGAASIQPSVEFQAILDGVLPQLTELLTAFEKAASRVTEYEKDKHKAFAQNEIHPLFMSTPFINRCYSKPLGYAGDYKMMQMIHDDPASGPNTYARILNYTFTRIPISYSVVNRTNTLKSYLSKIAGVCAKSGRNIKVLSIGCGPAIELKSFLLNDDNSQKADITLLDFNRETLDYALGQLQEASQQADRQINLHGMHESVHALLKNASRQNDERFEPPYDFVYCSGLFDYLSDRVCQSLIRLFYQLTAAGGTVFVTNMHTRNEFQYSMEHFAEWYLLYRNELDAPKFVPDIGEQRIYSDDTGVNLCVEINKPATQGVLS